MDRYIIDIEGVQVLGLQTVDACTKFGEAVIVTDEHLHFEHLPYASVTLTEEQVAILKEKNIYVEPEIIREKITLAQDYEQIRSFFYKKVKQKNLSGAGCKVAVMDSGYRLIGTPNVSSVWTNYDFSVNLADANPTVDDVFNHGTRVSSTIKSSIGMANGCELHVVRVINNFGSSSESILLAGISYCITNHIDIVNMSFEFDSAPFRVGIANLIAAGCVIAAGSGNNSVVSTVTLPATLPGVVAVNAIKEDGTPNYFNILPNGTNHGVTVACSGVNCIGINNAGIVGGGFGTSFSCPFFVAVFAVYKEQMRITDNYTLLSYILEKCIRTPYPLHFGSGIPTY